MNWARGELTPTTEEVKAPYVDQNTGGEYGNLDDGTAAAAEFDRWLRQVKADAWDEGVGYVSDYPEDLRSGNPYRSDNA